MPANDMPNLSDTDNHWRNTMPDYDWMAPLPASAPADARLFIETLAVWLGTDDAAEQMDEINAGAADAARHTAGPSHLAELACGFLSSGQSLDTFAEIHAASLAWMAVAQDAAEHLTADDKVTRALLPWIAAPDTLDVLGEITAVCAHAASLAGASDREITDWVTAWQSTEIGRTVLARIAALASVLAGLAREMATDDGVEI